MDFELVTRRTAGLFAVLSFAAALCKVNAQTSTAEYVQKVADGEIRAAGVPEKPTKNGWWARGWTVTDGRGFYGKPKTTTENNGSTIVIRYTRFSTEYDIEFHSPVWGAYTINKTTLTNEASGERTANNEEFKRPGQFFQEPLVLAQSLKLDVPAASHGTYTSTYDPRFPILKGGGVSASEAKESKADRSIQRGHMVPNNAMKNQGTIEQGQTAQIESFSVANIVPQMAKSNAPTWSGLEDACFDWAHELGQVWLFVGPVYRDRAEVTYIRKTKDDEEQILPSPDELFYVVIGKRNGKTSAVGFVLPHEPIVQDFRRGAVPVDEIERKTGINFMPDLGEPNPIETTVDQTWLLTKPRRERRSDDN